LSEHKTLSVSWSHYRLQEEITKIRRLTYTRLDEELEKIAHYPDSFKHSCISAHRLALIAGKKTD
ncbi:hypothetical protein ACRQMP_004776, partial [Escherichia coli]